MRPTWARSRSRTLRRCRRRHGRSCWRGRARTRASTRSLASEAGVKAGDIIAPARVALTGRKAAPGIFDVMWLLGRERVVSRLQAAAERWRAESPLAARP